ncbi:MULTISPECIES: SRPBCC family protein [Sphingobacterium]|uniref:Activator of Hsp90 ATPase-like protein n=2 Tax=Sphingobacterium siyangense TaxID=459529 RepID=A0A562M7D2_9SPHI|nr:MULTISPECIES: SRPBCC family protein [Sphingobacterium]TWI15722.1 activator of Hsp90 ATPase-like protein [Sphingobacterium siyangense]
MMKKDDFKISITVEAGAQRVFEAINNVRGWWSQNIEGPTAALHDEFIYHYQDVHRCRIRIETMETDRKVVWRVLENYFKFTQDEREWTNSSIIFDIVEDEGTTTLHFTHRGLNSQMECYQVCHDAWTYYIADSLRQLILTGLGQPTPKEKIALGAMEENRIPHDPGTKSIYHRLLIETPVETVYKALTTAEGLAGWWTPDTKAKPEIGAILRFGFGPSYFKNMEVISLKPYSRVEWRCVKAFEEWIGTTLTFELEPQQKGCMLLFHHDGWTNYSAEFASCSFDWALFFRSLKFFCEKGKGFPYPEFNV